MSTVLITGSSRGLGFEFARQYAKDGWQVMATCRNPEKAGDLQKLAQQCSSVQIEKLDVTDQTNIAALAEELRDIGLDLIVNSAGLASGLISSLDPGFGYDEEAQRFGIIDPEAWDRVLRVNTIGPVMVTQAFLPHLLRAGSSKVVMISSRMGSIEMMQTTEDIAYRTSKTALNAAMRCIALTLRTEKIIVISFHPGWVKTDMGTKDAPLTPHESVSGMRKVIAGLTLGQSGQFFQYDGEKLAW